MSLSMNKMQGGAKKWQSVMFVERALISVMQ